MIYQDLLKACSTDNIVEETSAPDLPSELELQSLWFSGRFGRKFVDQDGACIQIKQFGVWNRSAGPDFLHTCIDVDGAKAIGPIELDTHPSDWTRHGHAEDEAFNNTILHIVFRDSEKRTFTRTRDNRHVRRVVISPERIRQALKLPPLRSALAHSGRCSYPLARMPIEKINSLLEQAARHRLTQKARLFHEAEDVNGYDEALWQTIAQTLGYRPNALPLRLLAQRLPIHELKTLPHIEAILFGVAGFLHPEIIKNATEDSKEYLHSLWDSWWSVRDDYALDSCRTIPFSNSGQRPINHPQRRIAALAKIASNWSNFRKLSTEAYSSPKSFIKEFTCLEHDFWSHHYTLGSARTPKAMALIGKSRAIDLLINHILPSHYSTNTEQTWNSYSKLVGSTSNEKLKRAMIRLLGQREDFASWNKKAWQQQALLQIYQDFCLEDHSDCQNCAFPQQLTQW